ncbi:MAG: PIN domain-containing protein [Ferruginibacter sp.]|nr:PIN domain-containing protein [Cytophagales bacterium]
MPPTLFDTTVWIAYLNGVVDLRTNLLHRYIADDDAIFTCPTIIQEVLQGIRDDRDYQKANRSLLSFQCLTLPLLDAAIGAAELYRDLRKKRTTIRKANDCLIAFHALHFDVELCHNDSDFDLIAGRTNLKICQVQ